MREEFNLLFFRMAKKERVVSSNNGIFNQSYLDWEIDGSAVR